LPLREPIAAVACGIVDGEVRLDLDYAEDSTAQADANFVLSDSGRLVEVQFTSEDVPLRREQFEAMLDLAEAGVRQLIALQRQALDLET
jgi:ribonuclease PH